MNRIYDKVGYAEQVEVRPGRWEDVITERQFYGELVDKRYRDQSAADQVNDNLRLESDIEIIADAYALEHFSKIRYICYGGARWVVNSVKVDHPRLHCRMGGLYHGPTPS